MGKDLLQPVCKRSISTLSSTYGIWESDMAHGTVGDGSKTERKMLRVCSRPSGYWLDLTVD